MDEGALDEGAWGRDGWVDGCGWSSWTLNAAPLPRISGELTGPWSWVPLGAMEARAHGRDIRRALSQTGDHYYGGFNLRTTGREMDLKRTQRKKVRE